MDRLLTQLVALSERPDNSQALWPKFSRKAEPLIEESLRTYAAFVNHDDDACEANNLLDVGAAMHSCLDKVEAVRSLRELRDACGEEKGNIGKLRFRPLIAAVAQSLARREISWPTIGASNQRESLTERQKDKLLEFNQFWKSDSRRVLAIVNARVHDRDRAIEVTQGIYDYVVDYILADKAEIGDLERFLARGAHFAGLRAYRRSKANGRSFAPGEESSIAVVDEENATSLVSQDAWDEFHRHLNAQAPENREILIAHILDRFKPQAIIQKLFYADGIVRDADRIGQKRYALMRKLKSLLRRFL